MMISRHLWRGIALCFVVTACFAGVAVAQVNPAYGNAVRINTQYAKNQASIDALKQKNADHQAIIARLQRDHGQTQRAPTPSSASGSNTKSGCIVREIRNGKSTCTSSM
jgi:hypothetical protein